MDKVGGKIGVERVARPDRQTFQLFWRLLLVLALAAGLSAAFGVYEARVLGLSPLGETPPLFDTYHWSRMGFSLLVSALIVWTIYVERAVAHGFDREALPVLARSASAAIMGVGLGSTLLFLVDPLMFNATAQEDLAVEWISTLLLLGASVVFLRAVVRQENKLVLLASLMLGALFFVMAMEEISWMQRVFGFATPEDLAKVNWQGEFNFHNVQTDLFENVFYVGSAAFLILLPFVNDATPWLRSLGGLSAFVPGRTVAAASAPIAIFNYGMWNVLPQQMAVMIALLVMIFYATAARRRGDAGEAGLFAGLAASIVAGQASFLALGHRTPDIWAASEYKELFIAIGFAAYAIDVSTRLRRRA